MGYLIYYRVSVISLLLLRDLDAAVYFVYDLSPIVVTVKEHRRNFGHFITRLCAVLGGTFAVTGLSFILFRYLWLREFLTLASPRVHSRFIVCTVYESGTDIGSVSMCPTGMLDRWMFRIIELMTSTTKGTLF